MNLSNPLFTNGDLLSAVIRTKGQKETRGLGSRGLSGSACVSDKTSSAHSGWEDELYLAWGSPLAPPSSVSCTCCDSLSAGA